MPFNLSIFERRKLGPWEEKLPPQRGPFRSCDFPDLLGSGREEGGEENNLLILIDVQHL